jgi:dTDP-4-amino-4,6-dideoxygalactose transaminase
VWVRDLREIVDWADSMGIRVIEDAAHAQGLSVGGVDAGATGAAAVFSSGGGKPVFGPGGGWLTTGDDRLVQRVARRQAMVEPAEVIRARLRDFIDRFARPERQRGRAWLVSRAGSSLPRRLRRDLPPDVAPSFAVAGMADVEAGLVYSMLPRLADLISARRFNSALWRETLAPLQGNEFRIAPLEANSHTHLWFSFRGPTAESRAEEARNLLWRHGVETANFYVPLHRRPFLSNVRHRGLARTEELWRGAFLVPVRPSLRPADRERIAGAGEALAAWMRSRL